MRVANPIAANPISTIAQVTLLANAVVSVCVAQNLVE